MSPQVKQMVVNGLLLSYYRIAPKKKARGLLLFLHGWGSNSDLWLKTVPPLVAQGYELYFLDLPGFGRSQNPNESFSLQDYSYTVVAFVEKRGLKKIHLVGHSFGGKISIKLAAENPELIDSLVLVDASGLPHKSVATDMKIALAKLVKPVFAVPFMKPLKDRLVRRFASEDYVSFPHLKQTFINIVNEDVKSELTLIKKPTLIIWGKEDDNTYTPIEDAHHMHQAIKTSELTIIPHAGHYSFLDQPEQFVQALLTFLEKHEKP